MPISVQWAHQTGWSLWKCNKTNHACLSACLQYLLCSNLIIHDYIYTPFLTYNMYAFTCTALKLFWDACARFQVIFPLWNMLQYIFLTFWLVAPSTRKNPDIVFRCGAWRKLFLRFILPIANGFFMFSQLLCVPWIIILFSLSVWLRKVPKHLWIKLLLDVRGRNIFATRPSRPQLHNCMMLLCYFLQVLMLPSLPVAIVWPRLLYAWASINTCVVAVWRQTILCCQLFSVQHVPLVHDAHKRVNWRPTGCVCCKSLPAVVCWHHTGHDTAFLLRGTGQRLLQQQMVSRAPSSSVAMSGIKCPLPAPFYLLTGVGPSSCNKIVYAV